MAGGQLHGAAKSGDLVVLVHGLGRTSQIFWRLRRALREAGLDPVDYDYPSRRHTVPESIAAFERFLDDLAKHKARGRAIHFVGFSQGAIMIRAVLAKPQRFTFGRAVMIAPPNKGVGFLRSTRARAVARAVMGPAIGDFVETSQFLKSLPEPRGEIGVIAGTQRFFPLNPSAYFNLLLGNRQPHDGTVEIESTKLASMRDFVTVPSNHTFICMHGEAVRQTLVFLQRGQFDHKMAA
ncbi:MAG: esterase/lipase family protein [Alphaproteobacteria bacterium]